MIDVGPRVLVDATAVPADRGGVGRYVDGLVAALSTLGADLALICQGTDVDHFVRLAPGATVIAAPQAIAKRPVRLAWEQAGLPVAARRVGAQVVHSPHYTMPLAAGRPVVVTLHDATFFTAPEVHGSGKAAFFRAATRVALHRAAVCVVPSEATRDELVRELHTDAGRLEVARHGVDSASFHVPQADEVAKVQARVGLVGRPFVAFLGTLEPRKNVPSLIRGWVQACAGRDEPPALVLAGAVGWDATIEQAVREIPSHLTLVRPGYLPLTELPGLLGGATVVAYPSLGEGFGLPVLEAMACGAAVLTTRRLALPEVGGDAVAYVEPDSASIAAGLSRLLDDETLRADLGKAAVARAAQFTWAASAQAHLASYRRAVA